MTRPWTPLGKLMAMDPDLYGPPEYEPPDPPQDDDWELYLEMETLQAENDAAADWSDWNPSGGNDD